MKLEMLRRGCIGALALAVLPVMGGCAYLPWPTGTQREMVTQLASAFDCRGHGAQTRVTVLPDAAAVQAFEAQRDTRFDLSEPLPPGPFAVVEMGARRRAGAGLAVSRSAALSGSTLELTATFFEPAADAAAAANDPCALVLLPVLGNYRRVELYDPAGVLRASANRPQVKHSN